MTSRRRELGAALWKLSELLRSDTRRSFRARAYERAVWALDDLPEDLTGSDEELTRVNGIGSGIAGVIREFRETGRVPELEQMLSRYPRDASTMLRLPRMRADRLRAMKADLGIDTVDDLLLAIDAGAAETLNGVGPATVAMWERVLTMPPSPEAMPAHDAAVIAGRLAAHLDRYADGAVQIAGQVRRVTEWVEAIDLLVVTDRAEPAIDFLSRTALASGSEAAADRITLRLHSGAAASVLVSPPARAGSALVAATGPQEHVRLLSREHTNHSTEENVYASAGVAWIPPPARSGQLIDATNLVTASDLRGDLHIHTDWSPDGHMRLEDVANQAQARGYGYLVITDHTVGLRFGALDSAGLRRQRAEIDELRSRYSDLVILHGAEINIDRDGNPDIDDQTLKWLDFVVAGCHSHFDLSREEQTARVVRALAHPSVRVLAHPTGRRIGIRPPFDLDVGAVLEAAAASGTALEVNGHRDRLDLSADLVASAVAAGVLLAANSDAHRLHELDNVAHSVAVMQRAGVRPESVVNTWAIQGFLEWARR